MTDTAIKVENLGKKYIIGKHTQTRDGLRHLLENAVSAPMRWAVNGFRRDPRTYEEFWALNDLNFEVGVGEVVGIIGRNGAGKSTLLKVLSRITEQTKGRITLRGRMASLLEVGTGFHPELTGRENIFLNGAILGMTRVEIKRKFDEIVDFAEVDKFLDTPVKRYSSGMYVRLAFAVAAHLEPEILVVDEVLAVGDMSFQRKCLGKMDEVSKEGRTVLFVSHNMQAVTRLCDRCILLHNGSIIEDGPAREVTASYMGLGVENTSERKWSVDTRIPGDDIVRLLGVRIINDAGELQNSFDIRSSIGVEINYRILKEGFQYLPHFSVINDEGTLLFIANDLDPDWRGRTRPPGEYRSIGWIDGNMLNEGTYSVGVAMLTLDPSVVRFNERDAVLFRTVDDAKALDTSRGDYPAPMRGMIRPALRWETTYTQSSAAKAG